MNNEEYSPGPWVAKADEEGEFLVYDANGKPICDLRFGPLDGKRQKANAYLVANAPEVKQEHEEMFKLLRSAKYETQPNAVCRDIHSEFQSRLQALIERIKSRTDASNITTGLSGT